MDSVGCLFYEPAKGIPNMPTANSAQTKTKTAKIIKQAIILDFKVFTFRKTISKIIAVSKSKIPPIKKSEFVQLTSFENCIPISGIINKIFLQPQTMLNFFDFV